MDFSRSKLNIIGKSKLWFAVSIVVIALGLAGMVPNILSEGFPLRRGIDFAGGSIIQLQMDEWSAERDPGAFAQEVKLLVTGYTEREPSVQTTPVAAEETTTGEEGLILHIRADASLIESAEAQENLYDEIRAIGGDFTVLEETEVGAVIGRELALNAVMGVAVGLVLILIYITIRLSFDFAVFAVVALFHDVLILCGIFALLGLEINSPFVAILLTVVGYSINDTIVIYDRIRENLKVKRHLPFDKLVNQSLLETLARSINTSVTTLLAIMAIMILGGVSLRTFMIGLGVGVFIGTYSSIFVASPLLVSWRLRGKGSVPLEEARPDVARAIYEEEDEGLLDLSRPEEEAADIEPITVKEPPPKARKKKPKRRRRRY